eukprot:1393634-Amorphochlora_amoeboformis.AAC.1
MQPGAVLYPSALQTNSYLNAHKNNGRHRTPADKLESWVPSSVPGISDNMARGKSTRACVLVLGDIGRSPRMQVR